MTTIAATKPARIAQRVDDLDWQELRAQLDERGFAITEPLLDATECRHLSELFDTGRFRSTIDMARHRFGDGRYRYFEHPLPDTIATLRSSFYGHLAPIANDWSALLRAIRTPSRPIIASCSNAAARPASIGPRH